VGLVVPLLAIVWLGPQLRNGRKPGQV
jgi:hypothetical protein